MQIKLIARLWSIVVALGLLATTAMAQETDQGNPKTPRKNFGLRDGDRVVFLGGTFIERAQRFGHLETAMTCLNPDVAVAFRNLGWSADTVWAESRGIFDPPAAGYKRLIEQLQKLKPTLVVVHYGTNESQAGESGLESFRQQFDKLLDDIAAIGSDVAIVSPHRFETPPSPLPDPTAFHPMMKLYANGLKQEAAERGFPFADMLTKYDSDRPLTDNGIHFHDAGYQRITEVLLERFGTPFKPETVALRLTGEAATKPVVFKSKARRLPWAGQTFRVTGLPTGKYTLKIDDETIATASSSELARGLTIDFGPDQRQLEELKQAIIKKNRLYFYRWRPQNITYLFGFRKHEQGNNAAEVAEFEPLVRGLETAITKLKTPAEREYRLTPVDGGQR